MSKVLVLGSGRDLTQRIAIEPSKEGVPFSENFDEVVTLDERGEPTIKGNFLDARLEPDSFDEIHAYEVLHIISDEYERVQKDTRFFTIWGKLWRILKPGGLVVGTVPHWNSKWVYATPAEVTVYTPELLWYLDREKYAEHLVMTNYLEDLWPEPYNFRLLRSMTGDEGNNFIFVLGKEKDASG